MRKFLILFIGLCLQCQVTLAQDPLFTQSVYILESINPGFSGFEDSGRTHMGLIHRTQWPNLDLKVNTEYLFWNTSVDYGPRMGYGFGVSVLNHNESKTNYNYSQVNINYAHRVYLNGGWYFRPALEVGFGLKNFAFGNILLSDQIDLNSNTIAPNSIDPSVNGLDNIFFTDISTGYVFEREERYGVSYWIGASIKHINRPNISFIEGENVPLDIFYSVHANIGFPVLLDNNVQIVANYMQQGEYNRLDIGPMVNLSDDINLGVTAVTNPAKNGLNGHLLTSINSYVGLNYDNFRFGLSYDYNTSKIGNTYGVYELSVTYLSRCRNCYTNRSRKR